ncbi:hypothetical protein [Mesoterricola sediminis]|uniref:Uncharacterized protein n=1 Tax=Mesoterricola sediminis TaxID=2927980 RepID=A0AA48KBL8_9BACT|nr:hypothetical protein [Mesoterricola sediminis]BDU76249.1 hypothetical protein METESE_12070 [Mesoterricola sediminis]
MIWTDYPGGSVRSDGAKVGEFFMAQGGPPEWWGYPAGWRPRGGMDATGPYRTRQEAKDALSSALPFQDDEGIPA